jgi:hypothetical protein
MDELIFVVEMGVRWRLTSRGQRRNTRYRVWKEGRGQQAVYTSRRIKAREEKDQKDFW